MNPEISHENCTDYYCSHPADEWLIMRAPDVLWFNVQEVGDYQGEVYGIGTYQRQFLIYEGYYGSCSGCGAWGEGGEPANQDEVLASSTLYADITAAVEYLAKEDKDGWYGRPDYDAMLRALGEADKFLKGEV